MTALGPALADVMPSALASMKVSGFSDRLALPAAQRVVIILIDGLGYLEAMEHHDLLPSLGAARVDALKTSFPSTTPTGLASLGMGSPPGHHGFLGASFWLPEADRELHPLHWGSDPLPHVVQPERTMFEQAAAQGVQCVSIGPAAYQGSGLTHSVLRGGRYVAAESVAERVEALEASWKDGDPGVPHVSYVYWAPLDRIGHEKGVGSREWCEALSPVDALVDGVRRLLGEGDTVIVTADHGMVNVAPENRVMVDDEPRLWTHVEAMLGEPRMRHLYLGDREQVPLVQAQWQSFLEDRATVLTREDVIAAGWWGDMEPDLELRAGDLLVIAEEGYSVASRVRDPRVSSLIGQHGARTDREMLVPAFVLTRDV